MFRPIDLVIIVKWLGLVHHAEIRQEERDLHAEKVRCDGGRPKAAPAGNVRLFVTFHSSIKSCLLLNIVSFQESGCMGFYQPTVKQKQADLLLFLHPFHFYANQIMA